MPGIPGLYLQRFLGVQLLLEVIGFSGQALREGHGARPRGADAVSFGFTGWLEGFGFWKP